MDNHRSPQNHQKEFIEEVGKKEELKLRGRQRKDESMWFGLGMFGLIGWAVAVPTLIGVALGVYLDSRWPSPISWTLICLFIGVMLGCVNAWFWVKRERRKIEEDRKK
jgi:ATP synthase protein I